MTAERRSDRVVEPELAALRDASRTRHKETARRGTRAAHVCS
jgi:hypothetical protein